MQILAQGYDPNTAAGMGIVLKELLGRISSTKNEIIWITPNGIDRSWKGCQIISPPHPGELDVWDILHKTLHTYSPDIYITNLNWQSLPNSVEILNQYSENTGNTIPVVLHTGIESEEVPPTFEERMIKRHDNPVHYIPFSKPHYDMLSSKDWCQTYIPHGVQQYYYGNPRQKDKINQLLGDENEDFKVVSVVAGNDRRKNLDRWLKTASIIKEQYNGDVRFVMHTSPQPGSTQGLYGGWELKVCSEYLGLEPNKDVVWTKEYTWQRINPSIIDSLYNDTDIYLSLSGGEGFGLPIVEAMSRKTACVLTDHINHRWLAQDGASYVPAESEYQISTGEHLKMPNVEAAADTVVGLLKSDGDREDLAEYAHQRSKNFRWDYSSEMLIKYMDNIES